MKALGKDIYDFYLNGWPDGYSHDTYDREITYWPNDRNTEGVCSLLEADKEYDLKDFGTLWDGVNANKATFEDAYLSWKSIKKPEPMTFDRWFNVIYPEPCGYANYSKQDLELTWNAAIASVKENL